MEKQRAERTPRECFRCVSVDRVIAKFPKPPKYKEKQRNQIRFKERGNCASQTEFQNGNNDNDQKIYASMARMSGNYEISSRYFGGSS